MHRLSPTRLWRVHVSVAAAVVVVAWGIAVLHFALSPSDAGAAQEFSAFVPATLLTLLMGGATFALRNTMQRLKTTDRALRREIRRSRRVLENMKEGLLLLDARGRVTFANGAARTWLPDARGRRFAAAIAAAGFELTHEDGSRLIDTDPIRSFCLKRGCDLDGIWLTRTGTLDDAWLAVSVKVLRDDDDSVTGATLTITDRSDEHERLNESALSANILENMHDAVMITDASGIIIRVNPAFTRLTGHAADDVAGRPCAELHRDPYAAEFQAAFWRQLRRSGHSAGRFWSHRKSGEEYCGWQTASSIRDARGHTVRYVIVSRDVTDQETRESELWQRANFDALTGLANRTRFNDRVAQAFSHASRHPQPFALLYLDLDHFKPVNDSLGHAAGDALLRQVAQRMAAVVRDDDLLARIGGDEFALLLPRIEALDESTHVAKKIVEALSAPFELPEGTVRIGISIGIAHFPPDGHTAEALAASADRALYMAKAQGRNGWHHAGQSGRTAAAASC